jgi:hypothetical protein
MSGSHGSSGHITVTRAATSPGTRPDISLRETLTVLAVFAAAAAALFATAPVGGDFWWSDAPRHALNGAFIKDLLAARPFSDPAGWAMQYYVRYPALTILFYPPAFYIVEAGFYAVFGVTHAIAQLAVAPYVVLLGFAATAIARTALPRWSAIGVGLLAIGTPEIAFWGRQVMLDVPAYATLLCGVMFFIRHLRRDRTADLALAAAFLVAAVYTKQTVIFILPALLTGFVTARGAASLLQRRVVVTAVLAAVALIPAVYLTMRFGAVNVESVAGRPADLSRWSLDAWLFYPLLVPRQLGWPVTVAGLCGLIALIFRPLPAGERWGAPLLLAWLASGYLFFSLIAVREPRHDLMALFPLVLCAALLPHVLLPAIPAQFLVMGLAVGTFGYSLIFAPPPLVAGYREIAGYVASTAPPNAVVLYSGYRDGNYVFDMREHAERGDITTIRADKLLLRVAVERARGVVQTGQDEAGIAEELRDLGISMVVAQPGFWTDLRQMARLERVLNSPLFKQVAEFPVTGTLSTNDGSGVIRIYCPTYPVETPRGNIRIDMPLMRGNIEGRIGASPIGPPRGPIPPGASPLDPTKGLPLEPTH